MFGRQTSGRKATRAERVYGDASNRIGSGSKEARRRASNAYDALLGRRGSEPAWGWLAAAALAGAAAAWVASAAGRRALNSWEPADLTVERLDSFVHSGR